jgi:enamine deaminase RidA (YjgF/YER057c/UK114 family)
MEGLLSETIEQRLSRLGVILPTAAPPAANYLPYILHGGVLYISGQLPLIEGAVSCRGKLGDSVNLEAGQAAARVCAINILAQAKAALDGDLERVSQILRITGYVASSPDFTDQHLVINGASNLLAEVLGPPGRHARAALGVAALPLDAAVEIDAIIAVA